MPVGRVRMLNLTTVNTESWAKIMPPAWHYVRTPPADGAYNMAVDTAMLSLARDTQIGIWRCYGWDRPTISFGRNELVRGRFDAASIAKANMQAVRRPTGGRALLHAAEVTYSVAVPVTDHVAWRQVYAAINTVLVRGLRTMGLPVELAPEAPIPLLKPNGPVCFEQPAPGELMVQGAKLVGSAVWRERGAFLQHGSILLHDTQHHIVDAAIRLGDNSAMATASVPRAASLATCLSPLPLPSDIASTLAGRLEDALTDEVRNAGGMCTQKKQLDIPRDVLIGLESQYRDDDWLWRR